MTPEQKQAKQFLIQQKREFARKLLSKDKKIIKMLVALLIVSYHCRVNRHTQIMSLEKDTIFADSAKTKRKPQFKFCVKLLWKLLNYAAHTDVYLGSIGCMK